MRAVVQRVSEASVSVAGTIIADLPAPGLVVLVGVTHDDTDRTAAALAGKIYNLRILDGEKSAADIGAPLLVVSQFTLYGDARKGRRPTWSGAAPAEEKQEGPSKLHQNVEIRDIGPCRKHIKVTIERKDIDERLNEQFKKLVTESVVAGFRPGKAPRRIIEKQFHREVGDQVKNEVLMASLQQLGDDHKLAPLSEPNLQLERIEIPNEGPLVYEFEVEVRPEFDLPSYKGMKIKRPVKEFSQADVDEARRRLLSRDGQ